MPAPRLYVMVGVPGCGKTTWVRKHLGHALRISLDDLRLMFSGRTFDPLIEPAVAVAAEVLLEAMAGYAAEHQTDLVFDATNVSRARRAPLIALAHRHGLSPVAVYLECPLETAHQRNQQRQFPVPRNVVERFGGQLEPPSMEEGFDEVIHIRNVPEPTA